jgi:hypothetical protein
LHDLTVFGTSPTSQLAQFAIQQRPPPPGYQAAEEDLLGAKYHFGAELERITHINRRLDLAEDILKLVGEATEVEPAKRPANGSVLLERMAELLKKTSPAIPKQQSEGKAGSQNATLAKPGGSPPVGSVPADRTEAEGVFAQQAELEKRLERVPQGWRNPLSRCADKLEVASEGFLRTFIVSLDKDKLRRVRHSNTPAGQKLLLNEFEALQAVQHENVVALDWARRVGSELFVATSWREIERAITAP